MDEEQKKWQEQFWNNSGGPREVFRLGCALAVWLGTGIGLTTILNNVGYVLICMAIFFGFASLTAIWQPAYSLLRRIVGNENMPHKLLPYKYKWWNYIPLIFMLTISFSFLLKGIQALIK